MIKLVPRSGYCIGLRVHEPEAKMGNIIIPDSSNPLKTDIYPVLILDAHPGSGMTVSKEEVEGLIGQIGYVTSRSLNRVSFDVDLYVFPVEAVITLVEEVQGHKMFIGEKEAKYLEIFYVDIVKNLPGFVSVKENGEQGG